MTRSSTTALVAAGVVLVGLLPVAASTVPATAASASAGRVELTAERTETQQVFANADGSTTVEQTTLPARYQRDGVWHEIDPTLGFAPDGSVAPNATPVVVRLSGGGVGQALLDTTTGNPSSAGATGKYALDWSGRLPRPSLSGNVATYGEVLPGVDLQVTVLPTGVSEVLVVKSATAARNPALRKISFGLTTSGLFSRNDGRGGFQFRDGAGRSVIESGAAWMWDSAGPTSDNSGPSAHSRPGVAHEVQMPVSVDATSMTITPSSALLTSPATVYPVYIDPTVSPTRYAWGRVSKTYPTRAYSNENDDRGTGHYVDSASSPTSDTQRSMFKFANSSYLTKHVLSASFSLYQVYSGTCTAKSATLYRIGAYSSTSTWNTQPTWASAISSVTAEYGRAGCTNPNPGTVKWDALTYATAAAKNTYGAYAYFGVRATDETDAANWRRYVNGTWTSGDGKTHYAVYSVTYITDPTAPTETKISSPLTTCGTSAATAPHVNSLKPTFSAKPQDLDGSNSTLTVAFALFTAAGAAVSSADVPLLPTTTTSGTAQSWLSPTTLVDGATYYLQTKTVYYVRGLSPYPASAAVTCWFTVDTSAGPAPGVTTTDYNPCADIASCTPGPIKYGTSGSFKFTAGAPDVSTILYTLDGVAAAPVTVPAGGSYVWTPSPYLATGIVHVLKVSDKDGTGHISQETPYQFAIAPGGTPVGQWTFDAGLADSSGGTTLHNLSAVSGATTGALARNGAALSLTAGGTAESASGVVDTSSGFTVAAWVRLQSLATRQVVVSQSGSAARGFELAFDPAVGWQFCRDSADVATPTRVCVSSSVKPIAGAWTQLVGSYDQTTKIDTIVVDGRTDLAVTGSFTTAWVSTGPFVVGGERTATAVASSKLTGQVDEVAVWNRLLEASEIRGRATGVDANKQVTHATTGSWRLDDASTATAAADSSGYGRPLALSGSPLPAFGPLVNPNDPATTALTLTSGAGQAARLPSQVVDPSGAFAVSVWVDLTDNTTSGTVVRAGTALADEWGITYRFDTTTQLGHFVFGRSVSNTSGAARDEVSSADIDPTGSSTWTNLIGVFDPAHAFQDGSVKPAIAFYIDGVAVGATEWNPTTSTWADPTATTDVGVGLAGAGSGYLGAQVSDVRLFTGPLSANDVGILSFGAYAA